MSKESKGQETGSENQQETNKKVQFFNPTKKPVAAPSSASTRTPTNAKAPSLTPIKNENSYFPTPLTYPVAFPTSATTDSPSHESSRIPTSLFPTGAPTFVEPTSSTTEAPSKVIPTSESSSIPTNSFLTEAPTEAPTFFKPTSSSTEAPTKAVPTSESSGIPTASFSPANAFLSEAPSKSPIQYSQLPTSNPITNDNNGNTNRPSSAINNNQTQDYLNQRIDTNTALGVIGIVVGAFAVYLGLRRGRGNEERRENTAQREQEPLLSNGTNPFFRDDIENNTSLDNSGTQGSIDNLPKKAGWIASSVNYIKSYWNKNESNIAVNDNDVANDNDFISTYNNSNNVDDQQTGVNSSSGRLIIFVDKARHSDTDSSPIIGNGSITSQPSTKSNNLHTLLKSVSISPVKTDSENEEKNSEYKAELSPVGEKSWEKQSEEASALLEEVITNISPKSDRSNNPHFYNVDSEENQTEKGNLSFDNQSFIGSYLYPGSRSGSHDNESKVTTQAQRRGSGNSDESNDSNTSQEPLLIFSQERSENKTSSPDYKSRTNPLAQKTSSIRVNPSKVLITLPGASSNIINFSEQLSSGQNSEGNNYPDLEFPEIHSSNATRSIDINDIPLNPLNPSNPFHESKNKSEPSMNYSTLLTNSPPRGFSTFITTFGKSNNCDGI